MALGFLLLAAAQTTAEFQDGVSPTAAYSGTRDAEIRDSAPDGNFGNVTELKLDDGPQTSALLKWNLAAVPPGSTVTGVSITVYISNTQDISTYPLYEMKRAWIEGDGGAGSGATWNTFDGTTPWQTTGAAGSEDRGSTVLATLDPSGTGPYTMTLGAAGVALVKSWVDSPAANYGFILQNYANGWYSEDFYAREYAVDATRRPKLSVTYTPPSMRFWIRGTPGNWNDPANWSDASGGAGGFSVPGPADIAVFDGGPGGTLDGDCTFDAAANVRGLRLYAAYGGQLSQGASSVTIGEIGATLYSGTFLGGTGPIDVNGSLLISGGTFASTSGTMSVAGDLIHSAGAFTLNAATVVFDGGGTGTTTTTLAVAHSDDDAEERASNGLMDLTSSDIELVDDAGNLQLVGLRFRDASIPKGATLGSAVIEFTADEAWSGATSLTFQGHDADDSPAFTSAAFDVSSRAVTTASATWPSVPAWPTVGATHQTPDLAAVIQEIIDRPGWFSGNAIAVVVTGSGRRTAESYEGSPAGSAARLIVQHPATAIQVLDVGAMTFQNLQVNSPYTTVRVVGSSFAVAGTLTVSAGRLEGTASSLTVTAANVSIAAGGAIDLSGRGYAGGGSAGTAGSGPGGGSGTTLNTVRPSGGALSYGSQTAPIDPGSGGGGNGYHEHAGGAGGAALRLIVSATLTVDGALTSDGAVGAGAPTQGGGAGGGGGAIWITCATLAGSGRMSARGGHGGGSDAADATGHGGDGGRIAVYSDASAFAGTITAAGGFGAPGANPGAAGLSVAESRISLVSPADGAPGYGGSVVWGALPGAVSYKVFVDDDAHLGDGEPTGNHTESGEVEQEQITASTSTAFGGLTDSVVYTWHVVAYDGPGATGAVVGGSESRRFTFVANQPPLAPTDLLVEDLTSPATGIGDPTPEFKARYNDPDAGDAADRRQIEVATDAGFASIVWAPADDAFPGAVAEGAMIAEAQKIAYAGPALEWNATYYWRIKMRDVGGAWSPWSATAQFSMASPAGTLSPSMGPPGDNWHIVGVPIGAGSIPVSELQDDLGGVAFYAWNEPTQTYVTVSTLQAGRGYWVQLPGGAGTAIDITQGYAAQGPFTWPTPDYALTNDPGTTLSSVESYYALGAEGGDGWHLVVNPYNADLDWTGVTTSAGVQTTCYWWDPSVSGQWRWYNKADGSRHPPDTTASLPKFQAFWVFVATAGESLTAPAPGAFSNPALPPAITTNAWRLQLQAQVGAETDGGLFLGIHPAALDGHDERDVLKMIGGAVVRMWVDRADWAEWSNRYAQDVRTTVLDAGEFVEWEVTIEAAPGAVVSISATNLAELPTSDWTFVVEDVELPYVYTQPAPTHALTVRAIRTTGFVGSLSIAPGPQMPPAATVDASSVAMAQLRLEAQLEPMTLQTLRIWSTGTADETTAVAAAWLLVDGAVAAGPAVFGFDDGFVEFTGLTLPAGTLDVDVVFDLTDAGATGQTLRVWIDPASDAMATGYFSGQAIAGSGAPIEGAEMTLVGAAATAPPTPAAGAGGGGGGGCSGGAPASSGAGAMLLVLLAVHGMGLRQQRR